MMRRPISIDTLEAVKRCFEHYGADPARWPAEQRKAYGAYADADELAEARTEASALDGFLGAATAPHMNKALPSEIMAAFDAEIAQGAKRTGFDFNRFLSGVFAWSRFAPVGAVAASVALGAVSGILTANVSVTPEAEVYAYLIDATPYFFDDAEVSQ